MLKQEIIEKITKYFKLTHFEAEKIYDDIFQSIMQGVKDDNITDVANLGEFIVKYNEKNEGGQNKTVEFLPSSGLEQELNQSSAEFTPAAKIETPPEEVKQPEAKFTEPKPIVEEFTPPVKETKDVPAGEVQKETHTEESQSVEDELKKKRDEILKKLTPQHKEEYHHLLHVEKGLPLNVPKPIVIKDPVYKEDMPKVKEEIKEEVKEEVKAVKEEVQEEIKEQPVKPVEESTTKSFSDYFTELKPEKKETVVSKQASETVIPPVAVNLHKEIVGEETPPPPPPPVKEEQPEPVEKTAPFTQQNGNGYNSAAELQKKDDSYYIWYKDSEPNAVDTQTMSYEYELLYQATKEAEYKSKLRIYVTTFILFFSIVLLLLIFSPVIYKYFFNPEDEQTNEEYVPEEQSSVNPENNTNADTPPVQNTTPAQETKVPPPAVNEQQNASQQPPQQQNNETKKEQPAGQPPASEQKDPPASQNTTPNLQGVVKTGIGWMDEKNKVIYVQLESGKYTIQESAWESDEKANKRISAVGNYNITGMKGNVFKADLGSKGVWYRARFGEFTSIEEAKQKAEELRNKERMKLQAFLFSILMIA